MFGRKVGRPKILEESQKVQEVEIPKNYQQEKQPDVFDVLDEEEIFNLALWHIRKGYSLLGQLQVSAK